MPELGLAITDEAGVPTATTMQFEHGNITWTPWTGSKITWAPGSTPTPTDHDDAPDNGSDDHLRRPLPPTTTPQPGNPLVAGLTLLSGLLESLGGR